MSFELRSPTVGRMGKLKRVLQGSASNKTIYQRREFRKQTIIYNSRVNLNGNIFLYRKKLKDFQFSPFDLGKTCRLT